MNYKSGLDLFCNPLFALECIGVRWVLRSRLRLKLSETLDISENLWVSMFWRDFGLTVRFNREIFNNVAEYFFMTNCKWGGLLWIDKNIKQNIKDDCFWASWLSGTGYNFFLCYRGEPNFFFTSYEEMKKDIRGVIKKLAVFLEKDLSEKVQNIKISIFNVFTAPHW